MGNTPPILVVLLSATAIVGSAQAHKPIFSDGAAQDAGSTIHIDNIDVSYVVYHEVTETTPRLWLSFDGAAGQQVTARLGVPYIDRLQDYRPALALLGPGLPDLALPFSIPEGLGGVLLTSTDVTDPEFFHEPFTGTDSWILGDLETTLSQSGLHYLVAYVPNGQTGKLWIAPGKAEEFGLGDIFSLPTTIQRVRTFHEISPVYFPCFLPVLAIGFLLVGGLYLTKVKKRSVQR